MSFKSIKVKQLTYCLLAGALLITVSIRCQLLFVVHPDIGGIESSVIYSIQRYLAGYPLYANPEVSPYSITQYSPLYYRLVAAVSQWLTIGPDALLSLYRVSRSVSLLANVGYALLLFGLSCQLRLSKNQSLIVAAIAFMLIPPQAYSRPDSVYGLLVVASLCANLRALQARTWAHQLGWLVSASGLAALAVATKQSGVVLGLLIAGFYALFTRQWLRAVGFLVGTAWLSISLLLLLMPEHDPMLLYANIIKGVDQGIDYQSFKTNIIDHFFRTHSLYNAVSLPLCVWLIQQRKSDYRWLGWSVLVLFGFALLTSLKWGSALNYFTEYVALSGIVVSLWVDRWVGGILQQPNQAVNRVLLFSVISCAVGLNIPNFDWPLAMRATARSKQPYQQQLGIAAYLTDSLRLTDQDAVFVTDYNYSFLNGILFRHCIVPQQDMVGSVMYAQHKFDYRHLEAQIKRHQVRFLITRPNERTTAFPHLSTAHFQFRRSIQGYAIYEDVVSHRPKSQRVRSR